uniref:Uncharacterized protein n=1 Tax=Rhizophora mucronata TaxID=61149 RepID=A0A2P2IHX5_RHIMU
MSVIPKTFEHLRVPSLLFSMAHKSHINSISSNPLQPALSYTPSSVKLT